MVKLLGSNQKIKCRGFQHWLVRYESTNKVDCLYKTVLLREKLIIDIFIFDKKNKDLGCVIHLMSWADFESKQTEVQTKCQFNSIYSSRRWSLVPGDGRRY